MFTALITNTIVGYQKIFSPLKPACCRFYPTCSDYMIQAIQKKGILQGIIKGISRISRCHPLNLGGYDPV